MEEQRTNLLLNSETMATQSATVTAVAHTLSFWGTGTVTLSGTTTGSLVGTGAGNRVSLNFTPTAGSLTLTVTGTVSRCQLEAGTTQGAFPTSYILTLGTQVTRAQDRINLSPAQFPFGTGEGTMVVMADAVTVSPPTFPITPASLTAVSVAEQLSINFTGSTARFHVRTGNAVQADIISSPIVAGQQYRIAVAWNTNDFAMSMNGATVLTDTVGNIPTGITILAFGTGAQSGSMIGSGHIKLLNYLPRRVSNAELVTMSTP
jgi:hypothetical protein